MISWYRSLTPMLLLTVACGAEPPASADPPSAGTMGSMAMPDMAMPSMDMLPAMRAYLDSLRTLPPNALPALMATLQTRTDAMLTAMDADMRAMSMTGDAAWQALGDSIRADLVALGSLSGEPLVLRTRAHTGRMRRLLEQHEMMMRM